MKGEKSMNPFMKIAIEEAQTGIRSSHGGPFGCVIVKDGKIIGKGHNEVIKQHIYSFVYIHISIYAF